MQSISLYRIYCTYLSIFRFYSLLYLLFSPFWLMQYNTSDTATLIALPSFLPSGGEMAPRTKATKKKVL